MKQVRFVAKLALRVLRAPGVILGLFKEFNKTSALHRFGRFEIV